MSTSARKKKRRADLFRENDGKCHWCGCQTVLPEESGIFPHAQEPRNLATIDHLYDRFDERRGGQGVWVLACKRCNNRRSNLRQRGLPMEELWARSKAWPQSDPRSRNNQHQINNGSAP